jgi:hypothetical protein
MQPTIEQVFVKPAREGLVMFDPTSRRRLPDEGMLVPHETYWRRRIANGDAVLVPQESPAPAPRAAKAKWTGDGEA